MAGTAKERAVAEIWHRLYSGGLVQRELAAGELYSAGWDAAIEAAAKEAEYYAANSPTARNILKAIKRLKEGA